MTKHDVMQCLRTVIDPELQMNIVELGLIYDVDIQQNAGKNGQTQIKIIMTLTTPGCPLAGVLQKMVLDSMKHLANIKPENIHLELTFDPPWTIDMMSESARAELGM